MLWFIFALKCIKPRLYTLKYVVQKESILSWNLLGLYMLVDVQLFQTRSNLVTKQTVNL